MFINQIPHGGAHDPRAVAIDGDVILGHFHRVRLGKTAYSPFRSRVVRDHRHWLVSGNGCGAQNLRWSIFRRRALGDDLFGGGLIAVVYPIDVDREHPVEVLSRNIEQRFDLSYPGVCDPILQ